MAGKVVVVTNRVYESGKSWIVQNLTRNLSIISKVLLIDLDPQGDSSSYFNVSKEFSIKDIFDKNRDFPEVVQKSRIKNLFILPGNLKLLQLYKGDLSRDRTIHIINYLRTKFDFIIIDTPPDFNPLMKIFVESSDKVIYPIVIDRQTDYYLEEFFREFNREKEKMVIALMKYSDKFKSIYSDIYSRYNNKFIKRDGEVLEFEIGKNEISKFHHLNLILSKS